MQPASPSAEQAGAIPRESSNQQKAKGKFGSKAPTQGGPAAAVVTQQSAPDETTEIRKPKSRCGGTVASTPASVPVSKQAGPSPRESGNSTESQRKVRIKAPARRPIAAVVTAQQSAPDETTEIRKPKSRCGGTVASTLNQRPRQLG